MIDEQHQPKPEDTPPEVQVASPVPMTFIERHGISPAAFAMIALGIVFFTYQIIGGVITVLLFGMNPSPDHVLGFRLVTGIGQLVLILIPTLVLARFCSRETGTFLRLNFPDMRTILLPLVGILSLQQMLQVYMVFQDRIPLPDQLQELARQLKDMLEQVTKLLASASTLPELVWVIVVIALIPAIAEEFLFRGLVQRNMEKNTTPMRAAVITGIIFGAYHLNPFSFVPLASLGMYLGFVAMRARSLWASVATHFFNNAYGCIMLYYNMDEDIVGAGTAEKMSSGELLLVFWFFGIIFIISTLYFLRITNRLKNPAIVGSSEQ